MNEAMPSNGSGSWPAALEDDPEMLRAALALIDECEPESGGAAEDASTTSEDTDSRDCDEFFETAASSVTVSAADASCGSAAYADELAVVHKRAVGAQLKGTTSRRREEIMYLRDKVKVLERALDDVKRRALAQSSGEGLCQVSPALKLWMELASRQKEQRQASELVNAKLRVTLSSQLRVAKDLMRLLQRSRRLLPMSTITPSFSGECQNAVMIQLPQVTADRLQECLHLLEKELDTVFVSPNFTSRTDPFRDVRVDDSGEGEVLIVTETSAILPFELELVRDAVWQSVWTKVKRSNEGKEVQDFDASCELFMASLLGHVNIGASRREAPRGDPLDGMTINEDAWIRLLPSLQPSAGGLSSTMTLVQSSRRLRLNFTLAADASGQGQRKWIGALTEHVLAKVDEELVFKQQLIESLLLQQRQLL
ncbi:hypothetical protein P43SY_006809 [Pythium insidiosum]|uniref:Uncharacterized protein n=1 Tax=Pythium insidiosum TaxID=114742 RepID=A0AAD5M2L2_PYTIN|nr:hypothetical protein P43SY_006809 [Pythium insidiosum]